MPKMAVIHFTTSPHSQKQRASGMSDGSLPSIMKSIRLPDAIHLPPMYGGTGLLVAEDFAGVKVFRSKDGLGNAAQYLGLVPWNHPSKLLTATKQIGNALDMNLIPFGNSAIPGTAGNAGHFLFPDITAQVSALVAT